jgi:hypothetical protein
MALTHRFTGVPLSSLNGQPPRKKVALVGASQLDKAERPPLEDKTWDVWGCNSLWPLCMDTQGRFRADAWFEMHPLSVQTPQERLDMDDCPVPLYVLGKELQPHWRTYPLTSIRQQFGERDYFTCTMCYQVAVALVLGYQEIGLWGMELWQGTPRERTTELRGLEYWLGIAKGRGVTVTLPDYSCLIQHPYLYGYDYVKEADYTEAEVAATALEWQRRKKGTR